MLTSCLVFATKSAFNKVPNVTLIEEDLGSMPMGPDGLGNEITDEDLTCTLNPLHSDADGFLLGCRLYSFTSHPGVLSEVGWTALKSTRTRDAMHPARSYTCAANNH